MKVLTRSVSETTQLGEKMGRILQSGDVVCLYGDLGAGKTAFVSGIGKGFGGLDAMPSPTFTIVHEYDTTPPLFHFDVYRVFAPDELFLIGFEEYFEKGGVVLIEWASKIEDLLPSDYLKVELRPTYQENYREINFSSRGERSNAVLRELSKEE